MCIMYVESRSQGAMEGNVRAFAPVPVLAELAARGQKLFFASFPWVSLTNIRAAEA